METKKAIGRQGWWFAEVDGIAIPCIHKHWLNRLSYHDPFKRHRGKGLKRKIDEAVNAMKNARQVVLTDDHVEFDVEGDVAGFTRKKYIAVFEIDDITYTPADGLRFRLVERLCNLR